MATKSKCRDCDKYEKQGHNYCRMCGYYFREGKVEYVGKATIYNTNENYCGNCGKLIKNCEC
jgi:hypothetical protein